MESKYKTLIPLIIIFFIVGVAVGYMAHKPVTIEKIVTVTVTPIPTPALTPTPTPTLTPTLILTPTPITTPTVSDFIVKDYYDPSINIPTATVVFDRNFNVIPNSVNIHPGDSVVIKITEYTLPYSLTLILNNSYQKDLGASGSAFVTFNKKGTYSFKGVIPSGDPNISPRLYAEGTIFVY